MAPKGGKGIFLKFVRPYLKKMMKSGGPARGVYKGKVWDMPGTQVRTYRYVKRSPSETDALRKAFNNRERKNFLTSLTDQDLAAGGIPRNQWDKIRRGFVPEGYQVHHIKPLDDNGTNAVDNLVLIRNSPDHQLVTNHQRYLTEGMAPNDARDLPWPFYPDGARVWPRPGSPSTARGTP